MLQKRRAYAPMLSPVVTLVARSCRQPRQSWVAGCQNHPAETIATALHRPHQDRSKRRHSRARRQLHRRSNHRRPSWPTQCVAGRAIQSAIATCCRLGRRSLSLTHARIAQESPSQKRDYGKPRSVNSARGLSDVSGKGPAIGLCQSPRVADQVRGDGPPAPGMLLL
jgi:hypothetical protein